MTILDLNDNTIFFTGVQPANLSPGSHSISAVNVDFWDPGQMNYFFRFGVITTSSPTARVVLESSPDFSAWATFADTGVQSISSGLRALVWFDRGENPDKWVRGTLTLGGTGGVIPTAVDMILTNFNTLGRNNSPFNGIGIPITEWLTLEGDDLEDGVPGEPFGVATKDPNATENYQIDWTDWLNGLSIGTSSWTLSSTGITSVASSATSTVATIVVSGGTSGVTYKLTNRIQTSTSTGATKLITDRTININVIEL